VDHDLPTVARRPRHILPRGTVRGGGHHTRDIGRHRLERPCGWQRFAHLFVQHALLHDVVHVDRRAGAGDGERLLYAADVQLGIDRRHERSGKLDAIPLDGLKAWQRERDRIHAWAQVDDPELTLPVGDRGPHLLDESGTRGFDRHPGQHGARGVTDHARNTRDLGAGPCGNSRDDQPREHAQPSQGKWKRRWTRHLGHSLTTMSSYLNGRMLPRTHEKTGEAEARVATGRNSRLGGESRDHTGDTSRVSGIGGGVTGPHAKGAGPSSEEGAGRGAQLRPIMRDTTPITAHRAIEEKPTSLAEPWSSLSLAATIFFRTTKV